jgi:cyclopropane-fatty-acyl-phospholipid synthase
MTTQILPKDKSLSKLVENFPALDNLCRKILFKKFEDLRFGFLSLEDCTQGQKKKFTFGEPNKNLNIHITVKKSSFYSRTLFGGSIGNSESYIDGDWECDNLTYLVRLFVLNRDLLNDIDSGVGKVLQPVQKIFHGLKANTIEGSKENIRSHYDIGNDFFKLFLDETMMYSCGLFKDKNTLIKDASIQKIATLCEKLELKPTDHLVEIGTGWGSLAIYAAKNYGCQVTTTTISQEQFKYAVAKVKESGVEDKVTVLFEDYRKLTGVYDKLVSVEMIEAVGLNFLDTYFAKCSSLIKDDGLMVLQAITIRDQYYESAKNSVDFIQRHIFPGTGIPSVHAMMNCVTNKTNMILIDQRDFAEDYAQTLKCWADQLNQNKEKITQLGYPNYLYRLWQYYFSYCEGGFRERAIGLSQMVLAKPLYRNRSLL